MKIESLVTIGDKGLKRGKGCAPAEAISAQEMAHALAAQLSERLADGWRRGERPRAEDLLKDATDLEGFPDAALVVVGEEIRKRRQYGPPPELEEYQRRFPDWTSELQVFFESHSDTSESVDSVVFPECGETVAGCRLVAELGRGAQGRVFLAAQTSLANRLVVLKMGPRDCREHLALARLLHTHIVPLYFVQDLPVHNLRVMAMPYLGGAAFSQLREELASIPVAQRTGRDLLAALDRIQAPRPPAAAQEGPARSRLETSGYVEALCRLGACLADALRYAHEQGMMHLDIKPSNVLVAGDGEPLLLDFHLARPPLPKGAAPPGWFGGTPGYMAPEQWLAFKAVRARQLLPALVDGRADVYSLGVVLFEMLGGKPAPRIKDPRRALQRVNGEVSPGLADVIAKCVDSDPSRRYQDAGALAEDLRRHLAHQPLRGAPNRSPLERWRKWRRRQPHALARVGMIVLLVAAVAAAGVLAGAYFLHQYHEGATALAEGEDLLGRGLPRDAERSLARGQGLVGSLPWSTSLAAELAEKGRQAHRAQLAQDLHRTADDLRFHYDPETLSPADAARLEAKCGALWDARSDLIDGLGDERSPKGANQVRNDLRDLAVLWVYLRGRMGDGESAEARRQQRDRLDEAEALLGSSAVLQYERARLRPSIAAAVELPPSTAWDHYALGRALLRDGKMERAAVELESAVALQPQGFWPNFYQGVCAYRREHYVEAEAALRVCVALAPESAECYYNHGLAENALGRRKRARADYDQALQLDAGYADAWLKRGFLDHQEKQEDQGLEDLRQALACGADAATVHYNLALVQQARGDEAEARVEVLTALRMRPGHVGANELFARLKTASP
jgi:eukaryotic-like serine/threonine-protein kinase